MIKINHSDAVRVVAELTASSSAYSKSFILWLGVGSAGGAVALLSFAANLPNPDHALRLLGPSYALFVCGIVAAAATLVFASRRAAAAAYHHGLAGNRGQLGEAIKATPEKIAAPKALSDRLNAERNAMIETQAGFHEKAEFAWVIRQRWNAAFLISVSIACISIVGGLGWPLLLLMAGRSFVR